MRFRENSQRIDKEKNLEADHVGDHDHRVAEQQGEAVGHLLTNYTRC